MPSDMKININNRPYEVDGQRPLIDALRAAGYTVPTMCHAEGYEHHPSCMVCMVKDVDTGQMIPSCSTLPREGMRIETDTDEVNDLRRTALELLLSDHRADCEAPCTLVCKRGIDVAELIRLHDMGATTQARALMDGKTCEGCSAPCERACRRGTVDKAVNIREIASLYQSTSADTSESRRTIGFNSRLGRFTDLEKKRLQATYTQPSHCLHCACAGKQECKLRSLATAAGIKSPRYGNSSALAAKVEVAVTDHLVFEPAKCIRCGLCFYNTHDGFTFEGRGFGMRVVIRERSKPSITDEIARLLARICPTGALTLKLLLPFLFLLVGCRSLPGDVEKDHQAWRSFRGNSSLSGYTDCDLPEYPTLLWEHRHDVRTVASPLVYDGTVFICDKHGRMLGFDEQGGVVFDTNLESDVEASFVISDSTIYIGQINGEVRALSLSDGKERWKYPTEGQIKASPTITTINDQDYLLVGSYDNNGTVKTLGMEHVFSYATPGFKARATAYLQRVMELETYVGEGHSLYSVPNVTTHLQLSKQLIPGFWIIGKGIFTSEQKFMYVSGMTYRNGESLQGNIINLPATFLLDLGARYSWNWLEASVNCQNVLNHQYRLGGDRIPVLQQGTTLLATLSVHLTK